jgi:hypothetical protein
MNSAEAVLFVNKKNQKNFFMLGHGLRHRRCHARAPDSKKFLRAFFKKRCFPLTFC